MYLLSRMVWAIWSSSSHSLKNNELIEKAGGMLYLAKLAGMVASTIHLETWAAMIFDSHINRQVMLATTTLFQNAKQSVLNGEDLLLEFRKRLEEIEWKNSRCPALCPRSINFRQTYPYFQHGNECRKAWRPFHRRTIGHASRPLAFRQLRPERTCLARNRLQHTEQPSLLHRRHLTTHHQRKHPIKHI